MTVEHEPKAAPRTDRVVLPPLRADNRVVIGFAVANIVGVLAGLGLGYLIITFF